MIPRPPRSTLTATPFPYPTLFLSAPSRGGLVSGYLRSTLGARAYGESLPPIASRYAGFNLLLGDRDGVWYLSNKPQFAMQPLTPGLHAVSNASLDTPWPKLVALKSKKIGRASCRERVCQYVKI